MDRLQKNRNKKTSVYVINNDFQIVYYNDELKCIDSELTNGQYCYEVVYGEESQCKRCPLREKNKGKSVIFDRTQNKWLSVASVPIEMPGVGKCNVITSESMENESEGFLKESDNWCYNKKCFFSVAGEVLKNDVSVRWCMLSIDIENFKLFNEWYGRKMGDRLLTGIYECMKRQQEEKFCVAGYFGNDDFVMLMPYDEDQIDELYLSISTLLESYGNKTKFLPLFGIYEITDRTESICTMYDRAELARASVKGNYTVRVKKFDMEMLEELEAQYFLYSDIQKALKTNEFTFFLQPKCNMESGKIIGAEALVRWESAEKGTVSPGVFIPFLEKTGLITELDLYVWEEVCKWQRGLIDRGIHPVPVSVNVSRMDLYYMGVPAYFRELIKKYDLSQELIEIEITESVYAEEDIFISEAIAELRRSGFRVLMDDFGSGYSSLNMLKDIEIDVLKMDMRFLDINNENARKGINIMESILNMASLLGIKVIAEGVELEEQKEFLLKMGSGYGQGYYFYRPMPQADFEDLISDPENLDQAGFQNKRGDQLYLKDLLSEDMFSEVMLNNMLGALVFYDVHDGQMTVKRYNEQYAELFYDITLESGMVIDFSKYFNEEECLKIAGIFKCAKENRQEGAEGDVYRRRTDNTEMWLHLRMFF